MTFRTRSVGDIVAEDYRRAGIFRNFGIDFCCGGNRTLSDVCESSGIDVAAVEEALAVSNGSDGTAAHMQPDQWALDFLADFIRNVHHTYVRENLPVLLEFARKVARVHGHQHPEVVEIDHLVQKLAGEMLEHMKSEEEVVFPYVSKLVAAEKNGNSDSLSPESLAEPVDMMEDDHEHTGALLAQIRRLSHDFVPPHDACTTYRALFAKLEEFEEDLHRHVHLENNILFPKALALNESLLSRRTGASA